MYELSDRQLEAIVLDQRRDPGERRAALNAYMDISRERAMRLSRKRLRSGCR